MIINLSKLAEYIESPKVWILDFWSYCLLSFDFFSHFVHTFSQNNFFREKKDQSGREKKDQSGRVKKDQSSREKKDQSGSRSLCTSQCGRGWLLITPRIREISGPLIIRSTNTQTHTYRDTQTDTQTHIQRHTNRHTDIHTYIHKEIHT